VVLLRTRPRRGRHRRAVPGRAALGAGAAAEAKSLARRIAAIGLASGAAFAVVIGAGAGVLPELFSSDPQVFAQAMRAWPWFAAMQPLAGWCSRSTGC